MTNEIRSYILGLPSTEEPVRWGQWVPPSFEIGSASPAEVEAREALLGRPSVRENAEYAATVLSRIAMDFEPCRSAFRRVFGVINFSFELRDRLVRPGSPAPRYSPREAAVNAAGHIYRISANNEEAEALARSEWFSVNSGFPFVAVSAAILAISTYSRIQDEAEQE